VLRHRARPRAQDDADLAIGLALRDPGQDLRLARAQAERGEAARRQRAAALAQEERAVIAFHDWPDLEPRAVAMDDQRVPRRRHRVRTIGWRERRAQPFLEQLRQALVAGGRRAEVRSEPPARARRRHLDARRRG